MKKETKITAYFLASLMAGSVGFCAINNVAQKENTDYEIVPMYGLPSIERPLENKDYIKDKYGIPNIKKEKEKPLKKEEYMQVKYGIPNIKGNENQSGKLKIRSYDRLLYAPPEIKQEK